MISVAEFDLGFNPTRQKVNKKFTIIDRTWDNVSNPTGVCAYTSQLCAKYNNVCNY